MISGPIPQHPPIMLTPASRHCLQKATGLFGAESLIHLLYEIWPDTTASSYHAHPGIPPLSAVSNLGDKISYTSEKWPQLLSKSIILNS